MVSLLLDVAKDGRIQRIVRDEISHETDDVGAIKCLEDKLRSFSDVVGQGEADRYFSCFPRTYNLRVDYTATESPF